MPWCVIAHPALSVRSGPYLRLCPLVRFGNEMDRIRPVVVVQVELVVHGEVLDSRKDSLFHAAQREGLDLSMPDEAPADDVEVRDLAVYEQLLEGGVL